MGKNESEFGIIFWTHLFIIFGWYFSPFLISWYFVFLGVIFSYGQGLLINGCFLTHFQFGKQSDYTFWGYYLEKIGVKFSKRSLKIIFFWCEPIVIFLIAIFWQFVFGNLPFLF